MQKRTSSLFKLLLLGALIFSNLSLSAQTDNDGNMDITYWLGWVYTDRNNEGCNSWYCYNENEHTWVYLVRENGNVQNGNNWDINTCIQNNNTGCCVQPYPNIYWGEAYGGTVPTQFRVIGDYWEDDTGARCSYDTPWYGNQDDDRSRHDNNLSARIGCPWAWQYWGWQGNFWSNTHYSAVYWTSPRPNAGPTASPSSLCGSGTVTLSAGGKHCSGSEYAWYNGATLVGTTTSSTLDVAVTSTTTFTVYTRDAGNNSYSSRSVTVTVNSAPTANAGTAVDHCWSGSGGFNITAGASATNNSSVEWDITSGSGATLSSTTSLTGCVLTPTTNNGSVTVRLRAFQSGCPTASSTKTISWNRAPFGSEGTPDPTEVCFSPNLGAIQMTNASKGGFSTTGTWSTGTGSGSGGWSQNTSTPSLAEFTPTSNSGSRVMTLTVDATSGACSNNSNNQTYTRTVTWSRLDPDPGPAVSQCSTADVFTTGATITGSYASFEWVWVPDVGSSSATVVNSTSLNGCYLDISGGSGSGDLELRITAIAPCNNIVVVKEISWSSSPLADAGPALQSCTGTGVPIAMTGSSGGGSTGNPTWTGGGGLGTWTNGGTDPAAWTFTPSVPSGSFTANLQVVGISPCTGNANSSRTVSWSTPPDAEAGTDINSCNGNAAISLNNGSSATGTFNTISWNWVSGGGSFSGSGTNPTTYSYTPPNSSGAAVLRLTVSETTPGSVCQGESDIDVVTVNWGEINISTPSAIDICGDAPFTMSPSSVSGSFSTLGWTGHSGGSWTSSPSTLPEWTFTPSTSSGNFTATLTVTGDGACAGETPQAFVDVDWDETPTVTSGADIEHCIGATSINLTGASANGQYSTVDWTIASGSGTGTFTNGGSNPADWQFNPTSASGSLTITLTANGDGNCNTENPDVSRVITWSTNPSITSITATDNSSCVSGVGSIEISATGESQLQYSIDGGTSFQAGNGDFFNLDDGVNFNILVQDDLGCTSTYGSNPVVLGGPVSPVLNVTVADALCFGEENGTINVGVTSGGTPDFDFTIVSSTKTYLDNTTAIGISSANNVFAGSYTVEVFDAFGCSATDGPFVIGEPSTPITVSTNVVNNTNCTGTDGAIEVIASGGTPGYQYSFNGGTSFGGSNTLTNLGTGDYQLVVRDANNCAIPFQESIGGPFVADAGNDRYMCSGTPIQLNAQLNVNGTTTAAGDYSQSTIAHNPLSPSFTTVSLGDDDVSTAIPISFPFTFYGNTYNDVYISSNGFITFSTGSPNGCCSGQTIPNGGNPNNLIALAWEDLDPVEGGTISYGVSGTSPNRIFVVDFTDIQHHPSGNPITGQIQLYESTNNIEIHATSISTDGGTNTHTMGIENATGNIGTATHASASWSENNNAYLYQPPYDVGTVTYTWSPNTSLNNPNIVNPTVSGLSADQTYTLEIDINGICTIEDQMTVYVSDLVTESSGTYGTPPNVSNVTDVVCNGDDDGCITVSPSTGEAPYLLEGPAGEIQVYQGRMKELTVNNPSGVNLTDYQIEINVTYESSMRADFGDLRFYDGSAGNLGSQLSYYVVDRTLASNANILVKLPSIPVAGTTVYMTYGNTSLTTQSDPDDTYFLFEDMMEAPSGTFHGNASFIDFQFARLTQATNGVIGQLDYNMNPSTGGDGYVADFEFWIGGGNGADAIYQYSDCASRPTTEDAATGGYTFAYDTWQNQHQIKYNGGTIASDPESNHDNGQWREARVEQYGTTGRMWLDGVLRLTGTVTADNTGNAFGFGARTGGANNEHRVRNIRVRKMVTNPPTVAFGSEITSDNQFCDLAPGTYTISVWDVASCGVTEVDIEIEEPDELVVDNIDATDAQCYVANSGSLDIEVSGGVPAYIYNWVGPTPFTSNQEDPDPVVAGTYNVTVADANGCSVSSSAIVGTATPINGTPNYTWTGALSNNWHIAQNWDCGIPGSSDPVILPDPSSVPNTPIILTGNTGECFNIRVLGNGTNLEIQNGAFLNVTE